MIEANYIGKKDDKMAVASLTDEDVRAIHQLAKEERIGERVCVCVEEGVDECVWVTGWVCGWLGVCMWRRGYMYMHHKANGLLCVIVSIAPSPPVDNCQHCTFHIWS